MLTKASQRARNLSRRLDNSFEQALIEVWRQVLVENNKAVHAGHRARYLVRRALKRGLRPLDFMFDGNEIRGLEQNPQTKSWWAQLARSGKVAYLPDTLRKLFIVRVNLPGVQVSGA